MNITSFIPAIQSNWMNPIVIVGGVVAIGAICLKKIYKNKISKIMQDCTISFPSIPKIKNIENGKFPENPLYVGSAYNTETQKWEQINIFYTFQDEEHNFFAQNVSKKCLGRIKILKFETMKDGKFGSPALVFQFDSTSKYGNEVNLIPKIEVKDLKNEEKNRYKYIGYNLMKVAMQKFKEFKCRVDLSAAWNSHIFYWKLGFRPNDLQECRRIAQQVWKGPTNQDLGIVKMHLPQWASDAWLQEIKTNPLQDYA